MGIEDKIRSELQQGVSPKDLIEKQGYKTSTVYKVKKTIQTIVKRINSPQWSIENITFDKYDRQYVPGESVRVNFYLQNNSRRDLYVLNIGIQAEWMTKDETWWFQQVKDVVSPSSWRYKWITISFPIPKETSPGEYKLLFGMEGQFLPVQEMSIMTRISPKSLFVISS